MFTDIDLSITMWTVFILFMFKMYVLKENVQLKKMKGKY